MQLVTTAGAILCAGDTDSTADAPAAVRFNQIPAVWGPRSSEVGGLVPAPCVVPGALGLAASPAVPRARRYPVQVNNNTAR